MTAASVLLVDDDLDLCEAYAEVLRDAGHEVVTAHNGREALALLGEMSALPDLLLVDLMMPLMDGWQLQQALAANTQFRGLPMVIMTAGRRSPHIDSVEHLQKPVSLEALLETVARVRRAEAC
jgi:CheY-like chemotaxis protein